MKCPNCEKGELKKKKIREEMYGIYLGDFPAEVCLKCGESFVDSTTMKKIEKKAKEKGVWGLGMKTKIAKAGNSIVIRIPKKIVDFLKLKKGEEAFIHPGGDSKLIIESKID